MTAPSRHNSWLRELLDRAAAHWLAKTIAIPLFIAAFFGLYFALLKHPSGAVTLMPETAVDRLVGFAPLAMVPYVSLWLYVLLVPSILRGRRELTVYVGAVSGLTVVGLGIFFLWPTSIPPPSIDWVRYPGFAFLKNADAAGNACPSLHVAFAVFTAIWLERLLQRWEAPSLVRIINAGWSAAIMYSTLATKQHVAVDVLAGMALGAAAGVFYPRDDDVRLFGAPYSSLNRQTLALGVSVLSKTTLWALDLGATDPFATAVLFLAPDLWILAGLLLPNTACLTPTATCFRTDQREVWLTIDDGPEPATTPSMLDALDRHQARATFFLIGAKAAAHPGLVREIVRRGHTIGNHTQTHPLVSFWLAGPRRTAREIDECGEALHRGGATDSAWFRPPAGIKTFFLRRVLAARGSVLVGWSARGRESLSRSVARPLRRIQRSLRPGAILLVHESAAEAAERIELLAGVLDHLTTCGYRCVLPHRDALRATFDLD